MDYILITGASGFVGTALINYLARSGYNGIASARRVLSDLPPGWSWFNRDQLMHGAVPRRPNVIIHLEVKQHVFYPTPEDLTQFEKVNVEGTREWLRWASSYQVPRFCFLSSIKVAKNSELCMDEASICEPDSAYGLSKLRAEALVSGWANEMPGERSALILRPAVVYGPGSKANIAAFVDAIYKGRFFLVNGSNNIKSIVSINNLCAAIDHLLRLEIRSGAEIFFVVDERSYSVADLARLISQLLGRKPSFLSIPPLLAKAAALIGDLAFKCTGKTLPLTSLRLKALSETTHFSGKKLNETGFSHPESTEEGLKQLVDWYLSSQRMRSEDAN